MGNNIKYWVATSGGVDSVVLIHLLKETGNDFGLLHCNFNLRGADSVQDEVFVRDLAKALNVPIQVQEFDTLQYGKENRLNTQLAARELRYAWFDDLIKKEKIVVLLGHHYNDQQETFFLQLRRGGGVKGLSGMPIYKNGYLRPMLSYRKTDLIEIAKKNNWNWREDVTNASNDYKRNWYRNEMLPFLKEINFPLEEVVPLMFSFQKILKLLNSFPIPVKIEITDWNASPIWFRQHLLSEWGLGEFSEKEISRLANSKKGKFIGNEKVKVWNEGDCLMLSSKNESTDIYMLKTTCLEKLPSKINAESIYLDRQKVSGEYYCRPWQAGDYFYPLGLNGKKKVAKFLRDKKVPASLKDEIHVLVDSSEQVVGIFGFGVSEKFKVETDSKEILCVSLIKEK